MQDALNDARSGKTERAELLAKEGLSQVNQFAASRFGGLWKLLFFVGAVSVLAAGVLGIIGGITNLLSPFSFCNQVYLCVFGLIMLVIDAPIAQAEEAKFAVFRYLLFMTRFTGRGVWYLFLATMIWASLFNLGLEPFLGFFLSGYVAVLGALSIFVGVQKSLRLEKMRKAICAQGPAAVMELCPAAYGLFSIFCVLALGLAT
ncbi:unnamed protein product [Amoebophrya sp. A25]|nr:unnamed protein product [Amoebophrya sp. A25]|eukprot:GSA25T00003282001.1